MGILTVLGELEQLERKLADLYGWLSEVFAADAEAAFVFYRMSREEESHMRLIQYQRRLIRANAEAFANIEANLEEVRRTSAAVDQIRSSGTTPRLDEAITAALLIEDRAASYHLRTAIKQANPDVTRLLDSLGSGDRQHVEALRQLAVRHGITLSGASESSSSHSG